MKSALNSHTRTKAAADWSLHTLFLFSFYSENQQKRKYIAPAFLLNFLSVPISDSSSQRLQSGSFYPFGLSLPRERLSPNFLYPVSNCRDPLEQREDWNRGVFRISERDCAMDCPLSTKVIACSSLLSSLSKFAYPDRLSSLSLDSPSLYWSTYRALLQLQHSLWRSRHYTRSLSPFPMLVHSVVSEREMDDHWIVYNSRKLSRLCIADWWLAGALSSPFDWSPHCTKIRTVRHLNRFTHVHVFHVHVSLSRSQIFWSTY